MDANQAKRDACLTRVERCMAELRTLDPEDERALAVSQDAMGALALFRGLLRSPNRPAVRRSLAFPPRTDRIAR